MCYLQRLSRRGMGGDRLSRLASHVVAQQTHYPLWGSALAPPLDAALWAAHAQLPATPHLLVLPSNFRYFVKVRTSSFDSIIKTKSSFFHSDIARSLQVINSWRSEVVNRVVKLTIRVNILRDRTSVAVWQPSRDLSLNDHT